MLLILTIGLIGLVVGASVGISLLPEKDINLEIKSSAKTTLDALGPNKIERSQLDCNGEICQQKMWKIVETTNCEVGKTCDATYNLGSIQIPQKYCSAYEGENEEQTCTEYSEYSNAELIKMAEAKRIKRLEGIAEAIEKREATASKAKSVEGAGEINLIKEKEVIK